DSSLRLSTCPRVTPPTQSPPSLHGAESKRDLFVAPMMSAHTGGQAHAGVELRLGLTSPALGCFCSLQLMRIICRDAVEGCHKDLAQGVLLAGVPGAQSKGEVKAGRLSCVLPGPPARCVPGRVQVCVDLLLQRAVSKETGVCSSYPGDKLLLQKA
ncbi:unnamed protein product, partial [Pleuronectes platessa]